MARPKKLEVLDLFPINSTFVTSIEIVILRKKFPKLKLCQLKIL